MKELDPILPNEKERERSKHNERNQIVLWESLASALRQALLASFTPLFRVKSHVRKELCRSTGISAIRFAAAIFRDVLTIFTGISAEISESSAEISDAPIPGLTKSESRTGPRKKTTMETFGFSSARATTFARHARVP